MLSILRPNMEQLPFSDKNQEYCIKHIMVQYAFTHELLYKQSLLIELFKENGIPMAILKGSAIAIYYPIPSYRTLGDVDFIVHDQDFSKAYQVMLDNGYSLCYDIDGTEYHYTLKKDNITFELHRHPVGLPNGVCLLKTIDEGLKGTKTAEIEGYQILVLPNSAKWSSAFTPHKKAFSRGTWTAPDFGLNDVC